MKLRLLLWRDCNRSCKGCCNEDYDLDALPVCDDFSPYEEILLTGGEPMLFPTYVHKVIRRIRTTSNADIYIYTAKLDDEDAALSVLAAADGMTATLHTPEDALPFLRFSHRVLNWNLHKSRSLRANVFKGVGLRVHPSGWDVRSGLKLRKDCPLPEDEVFMRLKETL